MNVEPPRKEWPRYAVSPKGARARVDCMGDIPVGWTLEKPLSSEQADTGAQIGKLRAAYQRATGKVASPKWGADVLVSKITDALAEDEA